MSKENKGATRWLDYTRIMVDVNRVRWVNEEDALGKVDALEQRLAGMEKQLAIAVDGLKRIDKQRFLLGRDFMPYDVAVLTLKQIEEMGK